MKVQLFETFNDVKIIPYQIEIPDQSSLNAIVEGRKPNCYACGTREHMKTQSDGICEAAETEMVKDTDSLEYVGDMEERETKKEKN